MRYLYNWLNIEYESDKIEEDVIRKMLNSPSGIGDVIIIDRKTNKKYQYSMKRKLVKEIIK